MQINKLIDLKWRKGNINVMDDLNFQICHWKNGYYIDKNSIFIS